MLWFIKKMFLSLLVNTANISNHAKYISLNSQQYDSISPY